MPLNYGKTAAGDLLWVENPFTGVVTYVADIHRKRSGFQQKPEPRPEYPAHDLEPYVRRCAFCPGNESLTTTEVLRREDDSGNWITRAFYNLFPRIPVECTGDRNESYVLVESPRHFRDGATHPDHLEQTAALGAAGVRGIVRDVAALTAIAYENPAVASVVVRKNQGRESGASQPHPHTQVIGGGREFSPYTAERRVLESEPELWTEILGLAESERLIISEADGCYLYFAPFGAFPRAYEIVDTKTWGPLHRIANNRLDGFADQLHRALLMLGDEPMDYEIHAAEGIPLHAHIHSRFFPYSNIAGTLNLPLDLLRPNQ